MKIRAWVLGIVVGFAVTPVIGDDTVDAAIGGGVGGALGAAIGNEVGGRDGAIVGGALGAATGAAVTTDGHGHDSHEVPHRVRHGDHDHGHGGHFCPPGQAKKGRC